jgi:putative photosynthetic complex assembly protein
MTDMIHQRPMVIFPQKAMLGIATALALTIAAIGTARLSGFEPESSLPKQPPEKMRTIAYENADAGRVVISDAQSGEQLKLYASDEGAFVRATMGALLNDRKRRGITATGDFRLEAHAGKQLFLIDEASGKAISLNAFGPDNAAAFAAFLKN